MLYIVNRQIGVAEYVVSDDPLPPGHVTRRFASFAIKMAHWHWCHSLLRNGSSYNFAV